MTSPAARPNRETTPLDHSRPLHESVGSSDAASHSHASKRVSGRCPRRFPKLGAAGTVYPPLERLLANARRAEERGFASIWWPDHLMGWHPESLWTPSLTPLAKRAPSPHAYVDPIAALAAACTVTQKVSLGTAVTDAVRKHPATIAEEFLTLSHFSKGRAILGIGAGEGQNSIPYGLDFSRPAARLEEAITVIRILFESTEPVDFKGEFFTLRSAVVGLPPYEGRPPPIWVAAHGPKMLRICGELGDGWLPTAMPLDEYRHKLESISEAARKAGRDPEVIEPAMFCYCVPATNHEIAHRILENPLVRGLCLALGADSFAKAGHRHPLGEDFYGLLHYVPAGMPRRRAMALMEAVPFDVCHEFVWHGTADDIVERACLFAEAGGRHLVLWNVAPFDEADADRASFDVLEEVAERCRE